MNTMKVSGGGRARLLVVTSQLGGAGKTTVATNVAYGLAMRGRKVMLIDLSAYGADAHRRFDASRSVDLKRRGISALMRWAGDAWGAKDSAATAAAIGSARDVEFFSVELIPDRLRLLPGVCSQADYFESDEAPLRRQLLSTHAAILERMFDVLAVDYDAIVVDGSTEHYTAMTVAAFRAAALAPDRSYLAWVVDTGTPDRLPGEMSGLRALSSGPAARTLGIGRAPLVVVGNRARSRGPDMIIESAASEFGPIAIVRLPAAESVEAASHLAGVPSVGLESESVLALAFAPLIDLLDGRQY